VVRTQARAFIEAMLHFGSRGGRNMSTKQGWAGAGSAYHAPEHYLAEERVVRAKVALDHKVSSATPAEFWRCAACGREGHFFAEADALVEGLASVAEREDAFRARGGIVQNPVDRDALEEKRR
jgi:hypothetical protein